MNDHGISFNCIFPLTYELYYISLYCILIEILPTLRKDYKVYTNHIRILSVDFLAILHGWMWPLTINQMESLDLPFPTPSSLSHYIGHGSLKFRGPLGKCF